MRKVLSLMVIGSLCCSLAFGQTRTVTGKIVDEKGNPVPYASVKVKGNPGGVSADVNGVFTIKAKSGDVIEVSAIGQKANTMTLGDQSIVTVSLQSAAEQGLQEVVVTGAYNMKRTQRSTSTAVQTISDEKLNTIRQSDVNNALAGKVAGVQVRSQSAAKLGSNGYASVRLRGENSLSGNSNVLYVVDGTVIPTNSAGDINPDDIEDLTVLQGPGASAIFGAQGANGAIVITTKRAKKSQKGIGVEVNSGVTFDKVYILPDYQNSYAGGGVGDLTKYTWEDGDPVEWKALDGKYFHDYKDDASWGPRMVGQEYVPWYAWYGGHADSYKTAKLVGQPDNARDFYNTGVTFNNNVSFSKAGDNYTLRVSYTNLDIKGLLPNSSMKRNNFSVNTQVDVTSRLTLGANITYLNQVTKGEFDDGYSNNSTGSFSQWFHRDLDMDKMKDLKNLRVPVLNTLASWNLQNNPNDYDAANPQNFYRGNYWYNFFSYFDNVNNVNQRDRLYGDVNLGYKITNSLKAKFTYRKNQLTTNYEDRTNSAIEYSASQTGVKAYYGTGETYRNRENFEGLVSYSEKFNDFSVNANVGFDIMREKYKEVLANTNNGLNVDDYFDLRNSKNPISYANTRQAQKYRAGFVRGDIGWRNMLFAEFTLRKDYYSTLRPEENGIVSKSFGGSFVFSDLLKIPVISHGKLRASWGEVPATLDPYSTAAAYETSQNQWGGMPLMSTPNTLIDTLIRGAVATQREIGLDMSFLRNRVGFSVTYWDGTNRDVPLSIPVNGASGFNRYTVNAGEIKKNGVEVRLFGSPVRNKDFSWDVNFTYSRLLQNEVVRLTEGVNQIVNSSGSFSTTFAAYAVNAVGKEWGQLFGGGIKRLNGQPILTAAGLYQREAQVNFGSVLPDYTGGFQNSISYKNFFLNFNLDYQYGGKFFSLSEFWGSFSGLTAKTAVTNDKGNPVRDAVADGGGVRVDGVDADGKAVTHYVDAQTYFHQFQGSNIAEKSVFDLTFVKLREVSLGYRFDLVKLGVSKTITGATFSVVSRNPVLIYAKTKDFDPSEISNVYGEDGQMPGTRSIGFNLKLNF